MLIEILVSGLIQQDSPEIFLPTHLYTRHIQEKIKPFMLGNLTIYFVRRCDVIRILYKEVLIRDGDKVYEHL